jgi:hypothetical protein
MRQRTKQRELPQKTKPKKTRWPSFRQFVTKNILVLIGLILMALTLFFQIYFSWPRTKPETLPKPQFNIEQPARPTIPAQPRDTKCPPSRRV